MTEITKEDKIARLSEYLEDVLDLIAKGEQVSFMKLCQKHDLNWNSGARSLRYILVDTMHLIEASKQRGIYSVTKRYEEYYKDKSQTIFVNAVMKQINKWLGRPQPKQAKVKKVRAIKEAKGNHTIIKHVADPLPSNENHNGVYFEELELMVIRQLCGRYMQDEKSGGTFKLVVQQIIDKIN